LANGCPFIVHTDARDISTWIIRSGVWEGFVDDILCALVRPQDVVFDIGANMGYYTVKLGARLRGEGHIFSFEPNPELFEILQDNVNINGFADRATLFRRAVGNAPGQVAFGFDQRYPGGGQVGGLTAHREEIQVEMVRIDDVIPADVAADLIKIDVEGFEAWAFKGMEQLMARSPDAAVVMEAVYDTWVHHGLPSDVITKLAGHRRIYRIRPDGALEPLTGTTIDETLKAAVASYLLLLPPGAARDKQVARFLAPGYRDPRVPAPLLRRVLNRVMARR
jgi:FkbM family methyltransferase